MLIFIRRTRQKKDHAQHFSKCISELGLASNIGDTALPTFVTTNGHTVQEDYVVTSSDIQVTPRSQEIHSFAHSAKGGYHEPLMMAMKLVPRPVKVARSRRVAEFDRN